MTRWTRVLRFVMAMIKGVGGLERRELAFGRRNEG